MESWRGPTSDPGEGRLPWRHLCGARKASQGQIPPPPKGWAGEKQRSAHLPSCSSPSFWKLSGLPQCPSISQAPGLLPSAGVEGLLLHKSYEPHVHPTNHSQASGSSFGPSTRCLPVVPSTPLALLAATAGAAASPELHLLRTSTADPDSDPAITR